MGGSNGHSDELSCGEMYNPKIDEWIQVPELRTNRCNSGKHHFLLGNVLNICYLFEWAFSVRSWRLKIKELIMPVLVGTVKEWIILILFSSQVCVRCKTSFLWWADLTLVAKRAWGIVTHLTQWQKCGPAAHPSTSVCQFSFMFWNDFNLKNPKCVIHHVHCLSSVFREAPGGSERVKWICVRDRWCWVLELLKLSRALQPSKQHMDPGGPHERGPSWSWCGCAWR